MNKISLIIQREYLTRVKKRSFIVMTIIGPILMAALIIVPVYLATMTEKDQKIAVLDETGLFFERFKNTEHLSFQHVYGALDVEKEKFLNEGYYALLYIPKSEVAVPSGAMLYSDKQPNIIVKSYIQDAMKKEIESMKLEASGIDKNILESIKTKVNLVTIKMDKGGKEEKSYTEVSMMVGLFSSVLIYVFIFLFCSQVMRGVIEEKTNRIVEVIVSSVKPFQLMMGKIVGIALVGLTQLFLWVLLTLGIVFAFQVAYRDSFQLTGTQKMVTSSTPSVNPAVSGPDKADLQFNKEEVNKVFDLIRSINFGVIICCFLFYYLGGYLLYAALFAAIGSAVDNDADTQQFMMPVTIPLFFALIMAQFVINNPDGPIAFWLSIIPFTSPVIMMIRIPFGVPYGDLALSAVLLIGGFLGTTWLAARIYRTGILMYGKKVTYRELWKWISFKN
ncbi:MAG: ABC transporter permease [Bacteroidetes bacterium]|nr:ABC transporter permease [Bacteroidota bacterium]